MSVGGGGGDTTEASRVDQEDRGSGKDEGGGKHKRRLSNKPKRTVRG